MTPSSSRPAVLRGKEGVRGGDFAHCFVIYPDAVLGTEAPDLRW